MQSKTIENARVCEYNILSTGHTPFTSLHCSLASNIFELQVESERMREVLTNTLQWGCRTLTDDVPATGLEHNMYTGGHGSFNGLLVHSTRSSDLFVGSFPKRWTRVDQSRHHTTWLHFHSCGMVKAMEGDCYSLNSWRFNEVVDGY